MADTIYLKNKRFAKYKKLNLSEEQILEKEKRRCIRLVLVGNFLEYYDFTLFIHLAFLLNPLFLPQGNPFAETSGKVFMFCSAYLMRPFGALFWGWMGDRYGRVVVLNSTMALMGIASMAITTIPPYSFGGNWSIALIFLCRFIQGFAAGGELQAATVYMAEYSKIPEIYYRDGLVGFSCSLGRLFAGFISTICLFFFPEKGWMIPFWFGGVLAIIGVHARQALYETPDFLEASQSVQAGSQDTELVEKKEEDRAPTNPWDLRLILFISYGMNACLAMFTFGYCPDLLSKMGQSPVWITAQSTILAGAFAFSDLFWGYFAYKTQRPFDIFKYKAIMLSILLLACVIFTLPSSFLFISLVQLIGVLDSASIPLTPLLVKAFPVLWRCRNIMLTWAITKAIMYLVTSYLAFWLSELYGIQSVILMLFIFSLLYVLGAFRAEKVLKFAENDSDQKINA